MLPKANEHYKQVAYWNERYTNEQSKDWLLSYDSIKGSLKNYMKKDDKILMLGCGNSLLSEQMAKEGFTNIINIDYSTVVISKMASHCDTCSKMQWIEMDAQHLDFEEQTFDVVLEKATIDSLLVDEKNAWDVSQENRNVIEKVLLEVSRVLNPGGRFLSVSFSQPHFRGPLYAQDHFKWSVDKEELGQDFHYFLYIMTKGQLLSSDTFFKYEPPTIVSNNVTESSDCKHSTQCANGFDFLGNINV